ncbi:MAG TPA: hypothetical protein VFQ91_19695 [Bryobacteraceae bacterium]|nr:hypothetical protein [Bryobacteraceae bacterium]
MQKTVIATAFSAVALLAQPAEEKKLVIADPVATIPALPVVPAAPIGGAFTFMSTEMGFETSFAKGAPFSGDFVTESSQTLADGNRIRNTNTTSYARDNEGRTRRETTFDAIGPFSDGVTRKTIFIHDPVAKVDYVLDPQAKTVRKISLGVVTLDGAGFGPTGAAVGGNGRAPVMVRRMEMRQMAGNEGGRTVAFERTNAASIAAEPGVRAQTITLDAAPARLLGSGAPPDIKSEPLGKRNIEGVVAEGTRTTITIPAGQIGNDLPLETVSERWYSDELKTVVLTTRKDPRTGESTYRLTNLRRGEPGRSLFEPPSDYKLIEDIPATDVFRHKILKEAEQNRKQE